MSILPANRCSESDLIPLECHPSWNACILHRHWGVSNWTWAAVTHLSLASGTNVPQTGLSPLLTSLSLPFEAFCPLRLSNSDILLLRISVWMAPWSGVVYPSTRSNTNSLPARPICLMWSFPNAPDAVLTCPLLGPWLGLSDSNLIESIKTTSMEDVSTRVLEKKGIFKKVKPKTDLMYQDIYNCICQNTKK